MVNRVTRVHTFLQFGPLAVQGGFFFLCAMRLALVFMLFVLVGCSTTKLNPGKSGFTATYNLVSGQIPNTLVAHFPEDLGKSPVEYSVDQSLNGSLQMQSGALDSATKLFHKFDGENVSLQDATCLFLSKKTVQELRNEHIVQLTIPQGFTDKRRKFTVEEKLEYPVLIDGKTKKMDALHLQTLGKPRFSIWVLDSDSYPLIIRMDLGWQLLLSDIKT